MRKAGIDAKTRRAIMGHKTGSMDDRYTIVDDEALEDAIEKMRAYQQRKECFQKPKNWNPVSEPRLKTTGTVWLHFGNVGQK
jgi:hypothetical protein